MSVTVVRAEVTGAGALRAPSLLSVSCQFTGCLHVHCVNNQVSKVGNYLYVYTCNCNRLSLGVARLSCLGDGGRGLMRE